MAEPWRTFLAVALTEPARRRIAQVQQTARRQLADEPMRWVDPDSMHLTLRFLGPTTAEQRRRLEQEISARSPAWSVIDIDLHGLGCFPDMVRPRVLWAGARDRSGSLQTIAADLEGLARMAGFEPESRPFSAHLTLARTRGRLSPTGISRIEAIVRGSGEQDFGAVPVREIVLIRSELRPSGARYTPVSRFPIGVPA